MVVIAVIAGVALYAQAGDTDYARARWFSATCPFILLVLATMLSVLVVEAYSAGAPGPTLTGTQTPTASAAAESPTVAGLPVGATMALGRGAFAQTAVTLSAGQSLRLVAPSSTGGVHTLCLGANGQATELLKVQISCIALV